MPILKFKEFSFRNIITTKANFSPFVVLEVGLFVEMFEEHKSLFKLDDCLLQSINLCLANILPKVFEVLEISIYFHYFWKHV